MLTRFVSGIILLAIVVVSGVFGSWYFYVVAMAISLICLWEFYRMAGIDRRPVGIAGYVGAVLLWVLLQWELPRRVFRETFLLQWESPLLRRPHRHKP